MAVRSVWVAKQCTMRIVLESVVLTVAAGQSALLLIKVVGMSLSAYSSSNSNTYA